MHPVLPRREATDMLNEETKRKLRLMNLAPVIDIVDQQDSDVQTVALPFDQRFQRIVDFLYQEKYNEKVKRLVKSARLRFPKADVHDIYYSPNRKINRDIMNELATCRYISEIPVPERLIWAALLEKRPAVSTTEHGISGCRISWMRSRKKPLRFTAGTSF